MKFEFSKDQFSQLQPDKTGCCLAVSKSVFANSYEECTEVVSCLWFWTYIIRKVETIHSWGEKKKSPQVGGGKWR